MLVRKKTKINGSIEEDLKNQINTQIKNKNFCTNEIQKISNTEKGYDSEDDLENQYLINITKIYNNSSDKENKAENKLKRKISILDKKEIFKNFFILRILNTISILILLYTFKSIYSNKQRDQNLLLNSLQLKIQNSQLEINSQILNFASLILIGNLINFYYYLVSFIFAFFRNLFINKDSNFNYLDIEEIICLRFCFNFYKANLLFAFCLLINNNKIFKNIYGLDLFTCLLAFLFYAKIYFDYMNRLNKIKKTENYFNHFGFYLNISFTISWIICFFTILTTENLKNIFDNKFLNYIDLIFQLIITLISILVISYFEDIYFCLIIVIFQLGNTFNEHLLNFSNFNDFFLIYNQQNMKFILTLFTIICLLGTAIKKQKKLIKNEKERSLEENEIDEIKDHYENL